MKTPSEEDLILLYYGEHEDPELARQVAQSPELQARMDRLSADLALLDAASPPQRDPNYGEQVWLKVLPHLNDGPKSAGWLTRVREMLVQPRFSLAGGAALCLVAAVAFLAGKQFQPAPAASPELPSVALNGQAILFQQVAGHLGAADRFLTAYVNETQRSESEAAWAQELLLSNRLYRQAASAAGHHRIVRVLEEIEPLLVEMANQTVDHGDEAQPTAEEKTLLFKVRTSRAQLQESI